MVVRGALLEESRQADRLFHALADATRRDIVTQTLDRERSVSELAELYPMSFAAVQKHVAVLADAGLVSKHRRGREQIVRGEVGRVRKARTLFLVGRTRIHLDEVEGLGHFMELEVVLREGESTEAGVREAHGLMERLGVKAAQLIDRAYVDLLRG